MDDFCNLRDASTTGHAWLVVVMVSNPRPCGPVSLFLKRMANISPTDPSTQKIRIPSA